MRSHEDGPLRVRFRRGDISHAEIRVEICEHIGWGRGKAVSMDLGGELFVQRVLKM